MFVWLLTTTRNIYMILQIIKFVCYFFFKSFRFLACVNCVRWSCGGKYLATGGDDKLIMIWQMAR